MTAMIMRKRRELDNDKERNGVGRRRRRKKEEHDLNKQAIIFMLT